MVDYSKWDDLRDSDEEERLANAGESYKDLYRDQKLQLPQASVMFEDHFGPRDMYDPMDSEPAFDQHVHVARWNLGPVASDKLHVSPVHPPLPRLLQRSIESYSSACNSSPDKWISERGFLSCYRTVDIYSTLSNQVELEIPDRNSGRCLNRRKDFLIFPVIENEKAVLSSEPGLEYTPVVQKLLKAGHPESAGEVRKDYSQVNSAHVHEDSDIKHPLESPNILTG